eukprot:TRINITY_DN9657_c3_g1_i1.p1 TRINITY_DN9657_c3_g1~~TRINITY_DN9657_c3_g1_i1.p1  ORF type:complete len:301 (+),score=66.26 TRINITY_DN9657_c3_g1_i1:45-947(+)
MWGAHMAGVLFCAVAAHAGGAMNTSSTTVTQVWREEEEEDSGITLGVALLIAGVVLCQCCIIIACCLMCRAHKGAQRRDIPEGSCVDLEPCGDEPLLPDVPRDDEAPPPPPETPETDGTGQVYSRLHTALGRLEGQLGLDSPQVSSFERERGSGPLLHAAATPVKGSFSGASAASVPSNAVLLISKSIDHDRKQKVSVVDDTLYEPPETSPRCRPLAVAALPPSPKVADVGGRPAVMSQALLSRPSGGARSFGRGNLLPPRSSRVPGSPASPRTVEAAPAAQKKTAFPADASESDLNRTM